MLFLQCENVKVITPLKCTLVLYLYTKKKVTDTSRLLVYEKVELTSI